MRSARRRVAVGLRWAAMAWAAVTWVPATAAAQSPALGNGRIRAVFGPRGLASLTDLETGREHRLIRDGFAVVVDGRPLQSRDLPAPTVDSGDGRVAYRWTAGRDRIDVIYELRPDWRFLSKQVLVVDAATGTADGDADLFRVDSVLVFDAVLAESPADVFVPGTRYPDLGTADYGGALRFSDGNGLLAVVQNPFLSFGHEGARFTLGYAPAMEWRREWGPFPGDRGLLAPYRLSGRRLPAHPMPEWEMADAGTADRADPWGTDVGAREREPADAGAANRPMDAGAGERESTGAGGANRPMDAGAANRPRASSSYPAPWIDRAEVGAFTDMVRSFLLYRPGEPVDVYVGWTANDYQIDIATPEGRAEYTRMLEVVADVGAEHVVFAPTNSTLSRRVESTDYWSWENLLWLGLGQKIRKGEWDPRTDTVPASVRAMLDTADSLGLRLMAYVYPVVPFSQNPDWLVTVNEDGRQFADLGVRSLQDWLIGTLLAFRERTGISGYAFDHTFLRFPGTSGYAQWWGWRRVMEELRRRAPDIVIDGRQAYHLYGPWSWLAGSYPHPTMNDEQPESFVAFPDLHFDRVSADRQRYTAWIYRNLEFAPSEIVPGYMTHQTPRSDLAGRMPQRRTDDDVELLPFRRRDWDDLGWRFSVISGIATGGWANVVSMLPGRDPAEARAFSPSDRAWLRSWLEWTEENREYLRHTRTILGPPGVGKVDGTTAITDGRGFIFLFNPNARELTARFALDAGIGLDGGERFTLRELYPLEGRRLGKPGAGSWSYGDSVAVSLSGASALVLALDPADTTAPALFGAPGTVTIAGDTAAIDGVRGEAGTTDTLRVRLPAGSDVTVVTMNGRRVAFARDDANDGGGDRRRDAGSGGGTGSAARSGFLSVPVRFAGEPFGKLEPVWEYDPTFTGGTLHGRFSVPARVFEQLRRRQEEEWPIPWDPDDFATPWLAPQRLLLFVQIAEPDPGMDVRLRIDGQPIELRPAYSSIHPHPRTFVGFYADVSLLSPDREYEVQLDVPPLRPGRFQGLFFENVETEWTGIADGAPATRLPSPSANGTGPDATPAGWAWSGRRTP